MSKRAIKLKMPEFSAEPKSTHKPAKAVKVADPMLHMGAGSPVHDFHSNIERAYTASRSIEFDNKKVPFVVTIVGACAFSAACWALVIGVVSTL
jgi:hypothetical protein